MGRSRIRDIFSNKAKQYFRVGTVLVAIGIGLDALEGAALVKGIADPSPTQQEAYDVFVGAYENAIRSPSASTKQRAVETFQSWLREINANDRVKGLCQRALQNVYALPNF